ncbi:MAG: phosphatidate cytidylyltransferase, partial [Oscillospiraceae bacterium]|nr:phosphatidate cytidylyltransferase [Oscillospiraceae bacterium]
MLTRIISAAVGLVLFVGIYLAPPVVMKIALCFISAVGIYEVYKAYSLKKYLPLLFTALLSSPVLVFSGYTGKFILLYIFLLVTAGVITMLAKHESFSSEKLAVTVLYPLVISFAFSVCGNLRAMENGMFYFWLPFIMAWASDTFAYFTGRFFGKRKLCEKLSPKKTVEGAIGGVLGSVCGILVAGIFSPVKVNIIIGVVFAICASCLSQIGDIFASCIKRENGIKDFGNLMPGHGGVMDRFDSIL